MLEFGEFRLPVGAKFRPHAPLHERPAHRRRLALQLGEFGDIFLRQRIGNGGEKLRHLHDRALQPAERRRKLGGILGAVEIEAEKTSAGDACRHSADVGSHARIAPRARRKAVCLGIVMPVRVRRLRARAPVSGRRQGPAGSGQPCGGSASDGGDQITGRPVHCRISAGEANSPPARSINRTASSTKSRLLVSAPSRQSSSPTRTWPPRATACRDQRPDIDAEPRDHPRRAGRDLVQQRQMGVEIFRRRRIAERELVREHETVNRQRQRRPGVRKSRAEPRKARLIDRVARPHAVLRADPQALDDVLAGILIDEAGFAVRELVSSVARFDRTGIDHRPFDQSALRQFVKMRVAILRARQVRRQSPSPRSGSSDKRSHRTARGCLR